MEYVTRNRLLSNPVTSCNGIVWVTAGKYNPSGARKK